MLLERHVAVVALHAAERPREDALRGGERALVAARQAARQLAVHAGVTGADLTFLATAVSEIARNIVRFTDGGEIVIEMVDGDGRWGVQVVARDTGPGIPQELLPRLFEPFDRLGAENSDVEGTGIGLTLADALARAMGGRIEVSTEVGSGSTFVLVLRATHSEPQHHRAGGAEPDVQHDSNLHVLYIEDNPANLHLVRDIVAARPGLELLTATRGAAGLELARHRRPDLVLLDMNLPDLHGLDIARRMRSAGILADIIAITAVLVLAAMATAVITA